MISAETRKLIRFQGNASLPVAYVAAPGGRTTVARVSTLVEAEPLGESERRLLQPAFDTAGLPIESYRAGPLLRRLPACLRRLRVQSITDAIGLLQGIGGNAPSTQEQSPLAVALLETALIGHTSAFRDGSVFQSMIQEVLTPRPFGWRVWSVGCSQGDELLSVAAILAQQNMLHASTLRGTDCRGLAIAKARRRIHDFFAAVPVEFQQYSTHEIRHAVRSFAANIDWRVGNALEIRDESNWDMVLCRNVSIYLNPTGAARLWGGIERALIPGGVLIVGKAERPTVGNWRRLAPSVFVKQE